MKIKPKLSASLVLLLVGCLSACTEPTQPIRAETDFVASATSSYAITDLGNLGGSFAVARGISDAGQIVGVSETGAGQLHAFVWTIATGMTDLGTLGGANSQAFSINEHGNIAGSSLLVSGERHAFLWTAAAGMQDLGTLAGGHNSQARHINDADEVAGFSDLMLNGPPHPFLWSVSAGMTDHGTFGGDNAFAWGINNRTTVVGYGPLGSCVFTLAWSWTQQGGFVDLGALSHADPCGGSAATAVNDRGDVVGSSGTDALVGHAFRWTAAIGMVDLGALFGVNSSSEATAINQRGQVVGLSTSSDGTIQHPFAWDGRTGMEDLDLLLGDQTGAAFAISDNGRIVGSSGSHAVLWTPIHHM